MRPCYLFASPLSTCFGLLSTSSISTTTHHQIRSGFQFSNQSTNAPIQQWFVPSSRIYVVHSNTAFLNKRKSWLLRSHVTPDDTMRLSGKPSVLSRKVGNNESLQKTARRPAPSNRVSIRWVIESVEKVLSDEARIQSAGSDLGSHERKGEKLVSALWELFHAKTTRDVTLAGRKIEALDICQTESNDVQERVMKIVAMAGLVSLSLKLLKSMITEWNVEVEKTTHTSFRADNRRVYVPSEMAYIAVLNSLRKMGKLQTMRTTFESIVAACRSECIGVDIVAFNSFLAALCDAIITALNSSVNKASLDKRQQKKRIIDELTANHVDTILSEAVDLLRPGVARERYFTEVEPNAYSFNVVLNAAARVSDYKVAEEVFEMMKLQGVKADIYTFNARIRASKCTEDAFSTNFTKALSLVDEVLLDSALIPDAYTIEFALVPLVRAGRIGDILNLLRDFIGLGRNNPLELSSAFSTFLISLVNADEVETARAIFDTFILLPWKEATSSDLAVSSTCFVVEEDFLQQFHHPQPITRHFNTLIEAYRKIAEGEHTTFQHFSKDSDSSEKPHTNPIEHAKLLFDTMLHMNVAPDAYTITSMMGVQATAGDISSLWKKCMYCFNIRMSPAIYRSIMAAFGRIGDSSSGCYVFDHMLGQLGLAKSSSSWNVLLACLSRASAANSNSSIDTQSCSAAREFASVDRPGSGGEFQYWPSEGQLERTSFLDVVNGLTCSEAAQSVLALMKKAAYQQAENSSLPVPLPNSQSYCLVASAMSHNKNDPEKIINLFREAMSCGVSADGRFLNALIRCFGDDIDAAIESWKGGIRRAALEYENRNRPIAVGKSNRKKGKNLIAAYHGLFHVAGRAGRPDMALRLVHAMNKEGLEPTETTLNSYNNGKKMLEAKSKSANNHNVIRMKNQYESLLAIECTTYDQNDKRRQSEKRVRIIF